MDKTTEYQLSGITVADLRKGLGDIIPPGARITFAMSAPASTMGEADHLVLRWRVPEEAS